MTLRVKMRRKGSRCVYRRRGGSLNPGAVSGVDAEGVDARVESDGGDISTSMLGSREARGVYATRGLRLEKQALTARLNLVPNSTPMSRRSLRESSVSSSPIHIDMVARKRKKALTRFGAAYG